MLVIQGKGAFCCRESCVGLKCPVYLMLSEFRQSFLPSLSLTKQTWAKTLHLGFLNSYLKVILWDFPGGPVGKTSPSNSGGVGLIPGWGAKIPHAL